ncbi:MAG: hypothetical protein PUB52_05485 [Lachnospiraceae bacterium]|nr:hypothetical protein [Lachnospiraceae bacterium]
MLSWVKIVLYYGEWRREGKKIIGGEENRRRCGKSAELGGKRGKFWFSKQGRWDILIYMFFGGIGNEYS